MTVLSFSGRISHIYAYLATSIYIELETVHSYIAHVWHALRQYRVTDFSAVWLRTVLLTVYLNLMDLCLLSMDCIYHRSKVGQLKRIHCITSICSPILF